MAVAAPVDSQWTLSVEPVGDVTNWLERLQQRARGAAVALGIDCPIGLPRAYVAQHALSSLDFPSFLRTLHRRHEFFDVAETLEQVSAGRPFYPRRGRAGMTRLSHASALGLRDATELSRACDRATAVRPAGAPIFWTLGANQSGKAAISVWRDVLLPAFDGGRPIALWPFDGPFRPLVRPGTITLAETYPADALRQLGLRPIGSKRRQGDRLALAPGLADAMARLGVVADDELQRSMAAGFGADPAGEDRLDCVLGVLCVLMVIAGRRPDSAPADHWITRWEGWVLGQSAPGE